MSTRYYHTTPPPASTRVRCPICHEAVYSRAGIHPQCAARQAEPPRTKVKSPEVSSRVGETETHIDHLEAEVVATSDD